MTRFLGIAFLLAALLPASSAPAQTDVLLAGDDDALWLMAYDRPTNKLTVRLRGGRPSEKVQVLGAPAAACVTGGNLHVFFAGGAHTVVNRQLHTRVGSWPASWIGSRIYAACAARGEGASTRGAYLMIEMEGDGPSAVTAPATNQATQPAIGAATKPAARRRPVIYHYRDEQWSAFADVPSGLLPVDSIYHMAELDGRLYVLACDPAGRPAWLKRLADGQWEDLPAFEWLAADGRAVGLEAVHDLWLISRADADAGPAAYLRRVDDGKLTAPVQLAQADGAALVFDADAALVTARTGRRLAVAWRQQGAWKVANLELSGTVENAQPLVAEDPDSRLNRIVDIVRWVYFGLVAGLVIVWYVRRREYLRRPFLLAPQWVPCHWFKRVAAFLVDFMPVFMVISSIVGAPKVEWKDFNDLLQQAQRGEGAGRAWLTLMASLGIHCAYAVVMERLRGATLGKMLLRIRVVDENGRPPSLLAIVLRNATKLIELLTPLWIVFVIWPLISSYRQRFGDVIARTAVVEKQVRGVRLMPGEPPGPPPPPPDEQSEDPGPDQSP